MPCCRRRRTLALIGSSDPVGRRLPFLSHNAVHRNSQPQKLAWLYSSELACIDLMRFRGLEEWSRSAVAARLQCEDSQCSAEIIVNGTAGYQVRFIKPGSVFDAERQRNSI